MKVRKSKTNILLCSPNEGVGGISRWTSHILDYYKLSNSNLNLKQIYPKIFGIYQNTPLLTRLFSGMRSYLPFVLSFFNELRRTHYDLVHLVSSASFSLVRDIFLLLICKIEKVKVIIHFRFGRIPELLNQKNWEFKLLKIVVSLSDKVIVIDNASYNALVNYGFKNIYLLPNPLTPKVNLIIRRNNNILRKDRQILFAGHHVETKGVYELVEACKRIKNIRLRMIGHCSDEMRLSLIDLAGENCNEWLEILGEVDFDTTIEEMLSCSIFVLPTYTEGFPNVILESMACGCPIITTPVGAIPEILMIEQKDTYGLVVPIKNPDKLEDAIKKFLNNPVLARNCGANAKYRVNHEYSMSQVWDQMSKIWYNTIELK